MVKLKELLNLDNLLIAGDLNFKVSDVEVWGNSDRGDRLDLYFSSLLSGSHLVDIVTKKLGATWHNDRLGTAGIGKRLDRFLVAEGLLPHLSHYRSWTSPSEISKHFPISLDWKDLGNIPPYPFKFNQSWLKEPNFTSFIRRAWEGDCIVTEADPFFSLVG